MVTSNVDLNKVTPYPDIFPDKWTNRKFGERFFPVWYANKGFISAKMYRHFFSFAPDWIYLQGIYGFYFFLIPLFWAVLCKCPIIICPHGMLDEGSLSQKYFKKWLYLKVFILLGLHNKIRWQATSSHEFNQIQLIFGQKSSIVCSQLTVPPLKKRLHFVQKKAGSLRLFFYSRISPKKNLHLVLDCLLHSHPSILLSIVGPMEDVYYWENYCLPTFHLLGDRVSYKGCVPSLDDYLNTNEEHFMILPSEGENFSFAIFECLARGMPVIISSHTPWGNIVENSGGFILDDFGKMSLLLNHLVHLDDVHYQLYCDGAFQCAASYIDTNKAGEDYPKLFSCC
jgi:glycosyltransferase involved in cell wall biosynthesis